ncbi:MAG: peptide-N-glycosidase F-related protein, partial [Bacteroidota bacterium]
MSAMKRILFILTFIIFEIHCSNLLVSAPGDTIKIRTVEFGQAKKGKYLFPDSTKRFEKIIMNYKIKCPCGEWDYLAFVFANGTEIFRYITPYGNGLNLGNGFNFPIDVSDFRTLLHDSVDLDASSNGQENLEISFDFIEGTPPRDVIRFQNIFNIFKQYNKDFEQWLPPTDITFSTSEKSARLKVIQTGHAFTGNDNCNEFCKKEAFVKIDGTTRYRRFIWRDDCGKNPIYPQGGTWVYNRSNWCPGAEVRYHDYELTPYISSGGTSSLDY